MFCPCPRRARALDIKTQSVMRAGKGRLGGLWARRAGQPEGTQGKLPSKGAETRKNNKTELLSVRGRQ